MLAGGSDFEFRWGRILFYIFKIGGFVKFGSC